MSEVIFYSTTILFFLSVFPINLYGYAYISSTNKFASFQLSAYKIIPIVNKQINNHSVLQFNNKGKFVLKNPKRIKKIFNKICITKIIQLSEFGVQNGNLATLAIMQYGVTHTFYDYLKDASNTKTVSTVIFNAEHNEFNYCVKIVGVINLFSFLSLLIIYFWSCINERKSKKITR